MLAVELLGDRCHLLLGEVSDRAADELLLFGEVEVHSVSFVASSAISLTP